MVVSGVELHVTAYGVGDERGSLTPLRIYQSTVDTGIIEDSMNSWNDVHSKQAEWGESFFVYFAGGSPSQSVTRN